MTVREPILFIEINNSSLNLLSVTLMKIKILN